MSTLKMNNILKISHLLFIALIYSSFIYIVNCSSVEDNSLKPNCLNIKNLFSNEGLFLNAKIKSESGNSRICRRDKSCCTRGNELKLNVKSKSEFQQKFQKLINNTIESTLVSWADQFNAYYLNAIQTGHKEFDMMFERLYGPRYKENYEIFNDLFKGIASFHEKVEQNLDNTLDDFFEKLFVRLFKMLNPNFQFQTDFINCISSSMRFVEPFGDVPKNLLITLKRQLGATRTFVQGLYAGANIIKNLNQIDLSNSCAIELMQINYCSLCSGYLNLKPCKSNCEFAYSKCMINYQEFENEEWNKYLSTIIQFGKRLESTLNLENTLGSLNYKISDVIMYFQENEVNIRNKVFEKCNTKKISKRSPVDDEDEEDEDSSLLTIAKMKETHPKNQEISKTWKKLASEVKKKIKTFRSYWTKLPKGICKNSNPTIKCWNSTHSIDLNKQIKPAFELRLRKDTKYYRLIDAQKEKLQIVNSKLVSSYSGNGLEKFDFDSQATVNIGISTEPSDDYLSGGDEEEDDDYGDKIDATDQQVREPDDQNEEETVNKLPISDDQEESTINENLRSDTSLDPANAETNNIGNNFLSNNHESSGLENQPKDELLNSSSSYLLHLSIYNLIISQFLYFFIISKYF